ncbi:acetylesterase [Arthrobacter sp. JZ12]|uniref:acetylxylan esterase n=1 Tax=Arthrobacter sp. JZ12 TaxID=2654190 RepID=UPI002B49B907|nr:acetylxylan esterase [Arthrobacter sp. JZ12]WRH26100.1 acetylesterase [Arthrobacter sp. JZ12]
MSTPSPIAGYEDWPGAVGRLGRHPGFSPDSELLSRALGVPAPIPTPQLTARDRSLVDGVRIQELEWQLPYGPPTRGYLLTPADHADAERPLPGVLWLHCHGGNKWLGAERLVDRGKDTAAEVRAVQENLYSGRALANDIARAGFAVLVHDSFTWGSRRFPLHPAPARVAEGMAARRALWREEGIQPTPAEEYNAAAALHEHTVAKTAGLLGTSYAGMVAFEDLVALELLQSLPEVDANRVAIGGFSGGGGRALVLSALAPQVSAAVVSCMMTTFKGLFPTHTDTHSWLLATPGLPAAFDWPDLVRLNPACRYLVQFASHDPLFTLQGMRDADTRLAALTAGTPDQYTGSWHDAGHVVTAAMVQEALDFLSLRRRR